jgi:hypothetical protein
MNSISFSYCVYAGFDWQMADVVQRSRRSPMDLGRSAPAEGAMATL